METDRYEPLIIIGMHKSGTGLLAHILHKCGVFMGFDRNPHNEARFFLNLNKRIMRLAHADWDTPASMKYLLQTESIRAQLTAELRENINSKEVIDFLGEDLFAEYGHLTELTIPWGWKDPRTVFAVPIWLDIFKNARILHISRHGVDVAYSLYKREVNRRDKLISDVFSCRCMSLEGAFSLWVEYESACVAAVNNLPWHRVYSLRFEEFLQKPIRCLDRISEFIGVPFDPDAMATASQIVQPSRVHAFRQDNRLMEFYRKHQQHPLL